MNAQATSKNLIVILWKRVVNIFVIFKKKLVVHDIESAKDCFISWFQQDNEIMEELENLIPIQ